MKPQPAPPKRPEPQPLLWPRTWRAGHTLLCALVGGGAMAASQWLGPGAWTIWLVPACIVALALRARRRELLGSWFVLTACASAPFLQLGWHGWAWVRYTSIMAADLFLMILIAWWLARRRGALGLVTGVAAGRAVLELAWGQTPFGDLFAWGLYRIDSLALAQVVNFFGISALSAVICFVSAALAVLVFETERPGALRTLGVAVALTTLELAIGWGRLQRPITETVRVAAVSDLEASPERLATLTEAAAGEQAKVVVWPEASLTLTDSNGPELERFLDDLANENKIWLVVGVRREETGEALSVVASPRGNCDLVNAYRQQHPSPFGERRHVGDEPPAVVEAQFGGLSTISGYDLLFPDPALSASLSGATVLAVPTWGLPHPARHQAALVRARALENSLIVVRASRRGWSGVADPLGRSAASLIVEREPGLALVADVPLARAGTLLGDARTAFPYLMLLGLVILMRPSRPNRDLALTQTLYRSSWRGPLPPEVDPPAEAERV